MAPKSDPDFIEALQKALDPILDKLDRQERRSAELEAEVSTLRNQARAPHPTKNNPTQSGLDLNQALALMKEAEERAERRAESSLKVFVEALSRQQDAFWEGLRAADEIRDRHRQEFEDDLPEDEDGTDLEGLGSMVRDIVRDLRSAPAPAPDKANGSGGAGPLPVEMQWKIINALQQRRAATAPEVPAGDIPEGFNNDEIN